MATTKKSKKVLPVDEPSRYSLQHKLVNMERRLYFAYQKLKKDMSKKTSIDKLKSDTNNIILLLGEVIYIQNECKRIKNKMGKE